MIAMRKEQLKVGCCEKGRFESRCYVDSVVSLVSAFSQKNNTYKMGLGMCVSVCVCVCVCVCVKFWPP